MSGIQFPKMRAEVLGAVRALADREYQRRVWIEKNYPSPNFYDDFTMNVHILYDDTAVLPDPARTVGTVIHENEVEPLLGLNAALEPLIDELGDEPDATYLTDLRWPRMAAAAGVAQRAMEANES